MLFSPIHTLIMYHLHFNSVSFTLIAVNLISCHIKTDGSFSVNLLPEKLPSVKRYSYPVRNSTSSYGETICPVILTYAPPQAVRPAVQSESCPSPPPDPPESASQIRFPHISGYISSKVSHRKPDRKHCPQ